MIYVFMSMDLLISLMCVFFFLRVRLALSIPLTRDLCAKMHRHGVMLRLSLKES